jgi:hypothetical protein
MVALLGLYNLAEGGDRLTKDMAYDIGLGFRRRVYKVHANVYEVFASGKVGEPHRGSRDRDVLLFGHVDVARTRIAFLTLLTLRSLRPGRSHRSLSACLPLWTSGSLRTRIACRALLALRSLRTLRSYSTRLTLRSLRTSLARIARITLRTCWARLALRTL